MITTKEYLELEIGTIVIDTDGDTCIVLGLAEIDREYAPTYADVNDLSGTYGGELEDYLGSWVRLSYFLSNDPYIWSVLPEDIITIKPSYDNHASWFKIWGAPPPKKGPGADVEGVEKATCHP